MDKYGRIILFPYATLFMALAFITMLLVKHGESQKIDFKKIFKKKVTK